MTNVDFNYLAEKIDALEKLYTARFNEVKGEHDSLVDFTMGEFKALQSSTPKETPHSNKKIMEGLQLTADKIAAIENDIKKRFESIEDDLNTINCDIERFDKYLKDERFIHIFEQLDDLEKQFKQKALDIVKKAVANDA